LVYEHQDKHVASSSTHIIFSIIVFQKHLNHHHQKWAGF